jgi:hypothetical protein
LELKLQLIAQSLITRQHEPEGDGKKMADRKQFLGTVVADQELLRLLDATRDTGVTEEELHEQRISFAFGNAPADAKSITKDSVRRTSKSIRLRT